MGIGYHFSKSHTYILSSPTSEELMMRIITKKGSVA